MRATGLWLSAQPALPQHGTSQGLLRAVRDGVDSRRTFAGLGGPRHTNKEMRHTFGTFLLGHRNRRRKESLPRYPPHLEALPKQETHEDSIALNAALRRGKALDAPIIHSAPATAQNEQAYNHYQVCPSIKNVCILTHHAKRSLYYWIIMSEYDFLM